ncbi:DUF397 domain-containing protein [Embleya sp. NPDC059237]|uniref:DUF397 domain-containing protein n=1 Tax=unclassified Embleya TaxID=2699296 RepID=UPI0036AE0672
MSAQRHHRASAKGLDAWRTSSHSQGNGECVEVAPTVSGAAVRDSKDRAAGIVRADHGAWAALVAGIRR